MSCATCFNYEVKLDFLEISPDQFKTGHLKRNISEVFSLSRTSHKPGAAVLCALFSNLSHTTSDNNTLVMLSM